MPIPEERKLFKTGKSLAVTLPKTWIKHFSLEAGDEVEILVNEEIIIRVKQKSRFHTDLTSPK